MLRYRGDWSGEKEEAWSWIDMKKIRFFCSVLRKMQDCSIRKRATKSPGVLSMHIQRHWIIAYASSVLFQLLVSRWRDSSSAEIEIVGRTRRGQDAYPEQSAAWKRDGICTKTSVGPSGPANAGTALDPGYPVLAYSATLAMPPSSGRPSCRKRREGIVNSAKAHPMMRGVQSQLFLQHWGQEFITVIVLWTLAGMGTARKTVILSLKYFGQIQRQYTGNL